MRQTGAAKRCADSYGRPVTFAKDFADGNNSLPAGRLTRGVVARLCRVRSFYTLHTHTHPFNVPGQEKTQSPPGGRLTAGCPHEMHPAFGGSLVTLGCVSGQLTDFTKSPSRTEEWVISKKGEVNQGGEQCIVSS